MKIYTFQSTLYYDEFRLSLPDAHLFEHLLCQILVEFGYSNIHGNTCPGEINLHWSGSVEESCLLKVLNTLPQKETVKQEERIIDIECHWLVREFMPSSKVLDHHSWWAGCIDCLDHWETVVDMVETTEIQMQYLTLLDNGIEKSAGCINNNAEYTLNTLLKNSKFTFDYCFPLPDEKERQGASIHDWFWFLNGLCSYSSSFSQFLRSIGQNIYSYRLGVFPFNGHWYLFASGLHLMESQQFVQTLRSFLESFIIQGRLYTNRLRNELYYATVMKMRNFIKSPGELDNLLFNLGSHSRSVPYLDKPLDVVRCLDVRANIQQLTTALSNDGRTH